MHRLRHRRRIAHALSGATNLRDWAQREWRWLLRDVRDLRDDLLRIRRLNSHMRRLPPDGL